MPACLPHANAHTVPDRLSSRSRLLRDRTQDKVFIAVLRQPQHCRKYEQVQEGRKKGIRRRQPVTESNDFPTSLSARDNSMQHPKARSTRKQGVMYFMHEADLPPVPQKPNSILSSYHTYHAIGQTIACFLCGHVRGPMEERTATRPETCSISPLCLFLLLLSPPPPPLR